MNKFSEYLKEIVYGGVDGIITTFAVVAGFSGAQLSNNEVSTLTFVSVLLFGLANLFADGLSMGLGNFLSTRAQKEVYSSDRQELRINLKTKSKELEKETIELLIIEGFERDTAQRIANEYMTNDEYWLDWLMNFKLKNPSPENINPIYTGLVTFLSFIVFGIIPLLPFMLLELSPMSTFYLSSFGAFIALVLLGTLKWKVVSNIRFIRTIIEIVLLGGVAATVAFFVGTLFHNL